MLAFTNRSPAWLQHSVGAVAGVSSRRQPQEDRRSALPLPTGTLTLLFSDIEGSTRLLVVFPRAANALRAVVAAQRRHASTAWPDRACVRVRIGLHTGEARVADEDYIGLDVHRAARICEVAQGGHVIVSETTIRALAGQVIDGVRTRDLGEYWLKDLSCPLRLHQVVADGLATSHWPLRMPAGHSNTPAPAIPAAGTATTSGIATPRPHTPSIS